ncbi:sensor histidine kinase KdpD [Streptomyces sp. ST2-7A]|uniref:sensor histidine kinase n=1 Tax=Streptomyces sp. ST2-7A TaxID=2907214 RepID=UPI001F1BB4C6|nr:ATP-binding protein [Streptomyces sp. ST2-7A]MCE7079298.1 ATP-binding protein [Streptomyces sp. ST2-7A]
MRTRLLIVVGPPTATLLLLWLIAGAALPAALRDDGPGPLLVPVLTVLLLVPPVLLLTVMGTGRLLASLERGLADLRSDIPAPGRGTTGGNADRPLGGEGGEAPGGSGRPGPDTSPAPPVAGGRRPALPALPTVFRGAGPPPPLREIALVREALAETRRTAPVAERDRPAGDIRRAVVNVARRSRNLVNRQLAHIDGMERRTHDPEGLEELFVLDHLSTRMRRQAESLIILAGGAPIRTRRGTVPLADVVQAAIGEIEDYRRVDLIGAPRPSLVGHAATDIVHLLAELLENATRFSPPDTRVRIADRAVTGGHLLRIEDTGPGMSPVDLEAARRRARGPRTPREDLPPAGDRLGLFVVGRLARRRGLLVDFQASPHRGLVVSVLIPEALLTAPDAPSSHSGTP